MSQPSKFLTLDYLKSGSRTQQEVFWLFTESQLMRVLSAFHPVLAGTVPLDINIEHSDLDIVCQFDDERQFKELLINEFYNHTEFQISELLIHGEETIIANFYIDGWEIEVFGQAVPVEKQAAYRHLLAEHNLLAKYGDWLKQEVIKLKRDGYKTEPAFAKALNLSGDPYQALFAFENE